jgi:hypothetical protein
MICWVSPSTYYRGVTTKTTRPREEGGWGRVRVSGEVERSHRAKARPRRGDVPPHPCPATPLQPFSGSGWRTFFLPLQVALPLRGTQQPTPVHPLTARIPSARRQTPFDTLALLRTSAAFDDFASLHNPPPPPPPVTPLSSPLWPPPLGRNNPSTEKTFWRRNSRHRSTAPTTPPRILTASPLGFSTRFAMTSPSPPSQPSQISRSRGRQQQPATLVAQPPHFRPQTRRHPPSDRHRVGGLSPRHAGAHPPPIRALPARAVWPAVRVLPPR